MKFNSIQKSKIKLTNLDCDFGLHGLTGGPKNEREYRKEKNKGENKSEIIIATARKMVGAMIEIKEGFFLDDVAFLPWLQRLTWHLARSGESAGRRLAGRMAIEGGMRVRRRAHWAEHRRRMEGVCGLFAIFVGVSRWALNVVYGPTGRRRRLACHFRICLLLHDEIVYLLYYRLRIEIADHSS